MDEQEPADAIVYDLKLQPGAYSENVLVGEIRRLRHLLCECWEAAGLLGDNWTGQPYQAWEEPSDLVAQIEELWSLAHDEDAANA